MAVIDGSTQGGNGRVLGEAPRSGGRHEHVLLRVLGPRARDAEADCSQGADCDRQRLTTGDESPRLVHDSISTGWVFGDAGGEWDPADRSPGVSDRGGNSRWPPRRWMRERRGAGTRGRSDPAACGFGDGGLEFRAALEGASVHLEAS